MLELVAALVKLANEHGPALVLTAFVVVSLLLMARGAVSTWRSVSLSNANGRSQIDRSIATALDKLGDSNIHLTDQLRALVTQYGASMQSAQTERQDQARALERTLDRMEGMLAIMDEQKKAQRGMSNTLNEVNDRIGPIQTDLRDVSMRTAGLESNMAKMLDARLEPMIGLLVSTNTQVNELIAVAKSNGQNVEAIAREMARFNEAMNKTIAEFLLWKEMMFDRDDRYKEHMEHILKAIKPREKENSQ